MLKTSAYGLGFQHLPRDLANVNAWKSMFDPYIDFLMRRGGVLAFILGDTRVDMITIWLDNLSAKCPHCKIL